MGKLADFVILSDDPTAVDPETLSDIRVQVTIKDDKVIYRAEAGTRKGESDRAPLFADPEGAERLLHAMYEGFSRL